jgi:hypothetical protein
MSSRIGFSFLVDRTLQLQSAEQLRIHGHNNGGQAHGHWLEQNDSAGPSKV